MSTGEMEIQIGIETELYLDPRDPAFDQEYPQYTELGLRKLGEVFKNYYNDKKPSPFARIRLDFVNEDAKSELEEYSDPEDPQEYSKWSIMSDSSLKRDPTQGKSVRWPIELASPILPFKEKGGHRTEVEVHFEVLHSFAIAAVNRTCGLHIHMSPGSPEQQWTLEELQKIARSALWFESAFEVILPHSRRGNWFARSNKIENCLLRDLKVEECFEWIGKCQTIDQLVWLMCPWDFGSQNPAPMTFPQEDRRVVLRLYGWNFANLDDLPDNKGTIEFRRGPGVNTADLCNAWIDLVVPFVQSAVKWGTAEKLRKFEQNAGGLVGFILSSVPQDSVIRRSIKSIWAKHSKHESMEPIPSNLSTEERAGLLGGNHDVKRASLMSRKLRLWRNAS